jgi:hypothetical protein
LNRELWCLQSGTPAFDFSSRGKYFGTHLFGGFRQLNI